VLAVLLLYAPSHLATPVAFMPDTPNYFAFYGLPEAFLLDEAALKTKYYQLSRELHPDFHAQDTPAAQAEALRLSTLNTDAYRTLADPDARMAYLLAQHGLLEEGSAQNQLPSNFLMEVMDLNEQLMELELEPDPAATAKLDTEVTVLADTLDAGIQPVLAGYPQLPADHRPAALAQVKTYYLKKRYLLRLRQQLATFAARL
jgi:molecular chaperone HscB